MEKILKILQLYRTPNIGSVGFYYLLKKYKNIDMMIENLNEIIYKWRGKTINLINSDIIYKEYEQSINYGAKFIIYEEIDNYNIYTPPIFTYLGNKNLLNHKKISVVGTRIPSAIGLKFTKKIVTQMIESDFCTISGMALGIDTMVHQSSINKTIAVLAGGINIIYPLSNRLLYEQIQHHGLIISDQPFNTEIKNSLFPIRNRIIAALGDCTLVMESSLDSGAVITANLAKKMNKPVFAVPGHPEDPKYNGNNNLLKDGSQILTNIFDIINYFNNQKFCEKDLEYDFMAPYDEQKILELISYCPVSINTLAQITNLPINNIIHTVMELYIANILRFTDHLDVVLV